MGLLDRLIHSVLADLKFGYVTTYAIDCALEHPDDDGGANIGRMCGRSKSGDSFQPTFLLYRPPEIAVNPYTNAKMPVSVIPFSSNEVTDVAIKKWITENVPDFTQRLQTSDDAKQFAAETGI